MVLLTVASLISAFSFMVCTYTALYFAFINDIGSSLGFALLAGIWFILMVVFGYAYINRR
jgi:hypothetical protein